MGKLALACAAMLSVLGCGNDPNETPDGGIDPIDPCDPPDRVGACPPRGLYDGPVTVELNGPEATDAIHYTLDGTEPSESSSRYGEALSISPDAATGPVVVLRAVAFHQDGSRTPIETHSYVFPQAVLSQPALPAGHPETWGFGDNTRAGDYQMDSRAIAAPGDDVEAASALATALTVSLVLDHNDLWQPASGIYMRPSASGDDFERAASVELIFPDGESISGRAGLSIQGGSSTTNWKSSKLSMRLKFGGEHGSGPLRAELFDGSPVFGFANLILDAHLNFTWIHPDQGQRDNALYVGDQLVARLLNNAGTLAPRTRPVHLYLNGLYWGLYDLHERPDEHFAAAHLGGSASGWDVLRHDAQTIVSGDATAYNEMFNIARAGLADAGRYQAISELLAIDAFIDYMLINFFAGNDDWDHHNWYAIRSRSDNTGNGGFRFISWDAEHVFKDVDVDVTATENAGAPTELYAELLASPDFRARLSARAAELYSEGGALHVNQVTAQFAELTTELSPHLLLESARWGDNQSPADPHLRSSWQATTAALLQDYFPARSDIAAAQLPSP